MNDLKVSLSTASLYIYPLRKTFELAKRAGFDGVELVVGPEVEWRGGDYIRRLSREYALPILTVHPPLFAFPGWSRVHITIEPYLDRLLSIARVVGSPLIVLHMPHAKRIDDKIGEWVCEKTDVHARAARWNGP